MSTILPPNQFDSGVPSASAPDEAAASSRSHAPGAAAEIPVSPGVLLGSLPSGESDPSVMLDCAPGENHIGEIFVGAAKLEEVEIWFENAAYPREDELLYEVLEAMDDPRVPSLREMPYGMEGIFDPPPLFIQEARRA